MAGVHEHDHRFGDWTSDGFAARDRFVDEHLVPLEALVEDDLFPSERIDRALILAELRGERALRSFARWKRQPTLYSDAITRAAVYAFMREHAPLAERVATLAERLGEAPAVLSAAKANLDPKLTPPEWIDVALRSIPGGAKFLRETAPAMLPNATSLERAAERAFRPAAEATANALEAYAAWLREDLRPRANGSFAIGRDAVDAWLRDKELVDHDAASLRSWGDEFFRETEAKLAQLSLEIGYQDWRTAVAGLREDHPSEADLVATYRSEMERSRQAVATAQLATIPYGEDLVVEEMPEYQRPTYPYAAYVGAAPFESARKGRFWVTLPAPDDDERTRRERLEGHPRAGIAVIACHEGYPGHHLQLTVSADNSSLARKSLRSNLMVEGWGLYVEELMTELGYLDAPATRLLRLKDLLWRAARVMVDVGLSTGEMTFDEAVAFMVDKPRLESPNAIAEVRRYTLNPLQPSSYALGRAAIIDLRDRAKAAGWGMRVFHDRLLAAGSLPPKLLAMDLGI
ncbi:MAG: DUF885 domain-containing protein [Chloroflexi bacterium]|nr:MAG: DUF885 domain-containing protein [Chloroflexota bacterium]TMG72035.1 MAG: DUF885 domain-containing protein [Chloroflexota bacterium]